MTTSAKHLLPFAGGWEVHRNRHCIWIVSPENYQHQHAFDEFAQALQEAFEELGGSAPITRHPSQWQGRSPIALGANLLRLTDAPPLPADSILFNFEQVVRGGHWIDEEYLSLLRRYPVLDYDPLNIEALRLAGISNVRLLEVGFSPILSRIAAGLPEDVDILFYGSAAGCARREKILDALPGRGLKLVELFGVYGAERDQAIARSKIVLNLHYYEDSRFEIMRVSYLLANRKCVVSEGQRDDPSIRKFAGGIEVVPYDRLIQTCVDLADDTARREELATRGLERIRLFRQSALLAECMESCS